MKFHPVNAVIVLACLIPISAFGQSSALRIVCMDDNVGAEIHINGKFRGECPVDVKVAPGRLTILATKGNREFAQELRIGEDTVKKIEVILVLSAAGKAEQEKALETEHWQRASIKDRAAVQGYLDRYPGGRYLSEARARLEELKKLPSRPDLPFGISEKAWQRIESSDYYRATPSPKTVQVNSKYIEEIRYTGSEYSKVGNPKPTNGSLRISTKPVSDKCHSSDSTGSGMLAFNGKSSVHYGCGAIGLGFLLDGKTFSRLETLDEIRGSLFPMRIGAETTVNATNAAGDDLKKTTTSKNHCQVAAQIDAVSLHPKLSGKAWAIRCEHVFGQTDKPLTSVREDYFLEDLGVFLSQIGISVYTSDKIGRSILPTPGQRILTLDVSHPQYGSQTFHTYSSHEWSVGNSLNP